MKALWRQVGSKIEALSTRERIMVFGALLALVVFGAFTGWIEPMQRRTAALETQIGQQRSEIQTLRAAMSGVQTPGKRDRPDERQAAIKQQIGEAEAVIRNLQTSLVPADRMNPLLQELLSRESGLQLVSLRTVPVTALFDAPEKSARVDPPPPNSQELPQSAPTAPLIYRHGVEVTVRGGYSALYGYLTRLERSRSRMFWWRAQLAADGDPAVTLTLVIYTLSLDKAWLQV